MKRRRWNETVGDGAVFTVALIGPDGAGKSTVSQMVQARLPFPSTIVYMGVNLEASALMLPTTRMLLAGKRLRGRRPDMVASLDPRTEDSFHVGLWHRIRKEMKSVLRMSFWISEEWFRQAVARRHQHKGRVVIFDRHFFCDYYAYDIAGARSQPLGNRVHGFLLDRFYPRPQMVFYLDAPPEDLAARKPGASLEFLERRRQECLHMASLFEHFVSIDATQPVEVVAERICENITELRTARAGRELRA